MAFSTHFPRTVTGLPSFTEFLSLENDVRRNSSSSGAGGGGGVGGVGGGGGGHSRGKQSLRSLPIPDEIKQPLVIERNLLNTCQQVPTLPSFT